MSGLIEEIQRDASDDSVPVSQLLRRIKIAASKLRLPQLEEWVQHELNGYPNDAPLPEYRAIGGVPLAHSVFHGWRLLALGPDEQMNKIASFNLFYASISEAESSAASTGQIILSYPEWLERSMVQNLNGVDKVGLSVDQGKFRAVVNGVRNRALDWALAMEAAGVTGDGMSFTNEESRTAQNVTNNFYGDNARINQHSTDNSTNTVVHGNLFGDLKARICAEVSDPTAREPLLAAVEDMEAQQGKSGFVSAYSKFIETAANHMQIVQPFLGPLTNLLAG
ncbi:hypothetical protein [Brevundimonas sp. CEF1]|uniref:AbiTii domain-containing protein n=1 Tax=Brevundimonas sp. CEF1 TaxID=3442642 RepID=UPI003F518F3E